MCERIGKENKNYDGIYQQILEHAYAVYQISAMEKHIRKR